LCEDDVLHPECLAQQAKVLENPSNSGVVLAVCNRKVINAQDQVILSRRFPFRSGVVNGATLVRKSVRWGSNLIGEPAVAMFRRTALGQTTLCDVSNPYLSDLSLWAQLLKHGDAFLDKQYLAAFRISRTATSSRIGRGQAAAFRRFVRTLRKDPRYRITSLDAIIGYALSFQWCLIRNRFIKLHCSRSARQTSATSALETWPLVGRQRCSNPAN
jgi:hypothetical protein